MAKHKSSDATSIRPKIFGSTSEISHGIEKLRGRIIQVEELKKDGLPYRDALKVTTEYQIRDTIREIFGDHSPEFHEYQHYRIKVSSKAGVDETVRLLQHLLLNLEEQRLRLLGIRTATPNSHTQNQPTGDPVAAEAPPTPSSMPTPAPVASRRLPEPVTHSEAFIQHPPQPAQPVMPHPPSHQHMDPPRSKHSKPAALSHSAHQSGMKMKLSAEVRMKRAMASPPVIPPPEVSPRISPQGKGRVSARPGWAGGTESAHGMPATGSLTRPDSSNESIPPAGENVTQPVITITDAPTHIQDEVAMSSAEVTVQAEAPKVQKSDSDALTIVRKICLRFHHVARQLRQRRDDRPALEVEDEIDVQDVLQTLLCSQFEDICAEPWNPSYANGALRTDLILKEDGIVLVVKKTRQGIGAKTLADQLSVDVQRYINHPLCKTLLCFVYDPEGRVGNPGALAALMREQNGRKVEVLISPQ